MRGDSYHAIRLLDIALTGWISIWVEGQELRQKAWLYIAARQEELKLVALREWCWAAARRRMKREQLEMCVVICSDVLLPQRKCALHLLVMLWCRNVIVHEPEWHQHSCGGNILLLTAGHNMPPLYHFAKHMLS